MIFHGNIFKTGFINLLFIFLTLSVFSLNTYSNPTTLKSSPVAVATTTFDKQPDNGLKLGLKIVLVIDVSPSLKYHRADVEKIVSYIYDTIKRPQKDSIHLITFSDYANLHNPDLLKASVLFEIKNRTKKKSKYTIPIYGFNKVFDLVEKQFPKKVGVVLFISDGEDSMTHIPGQDSDMKRTISSLQNNGFNIFPIYFPTKWSNRTLMTDIAKWSGSTLYETKKYSSMDDLLETLKNNLYLAKQISPMLHHDFIKKREQWKKTLQAELGKERTLWENRLKEQLQTTKKELLNQYNTKKLDNTKKNNFALSHVELFIIIFSLIVFLLFIALFYKIILLKGVSQTNKQHSKQQMWGNLTFCNNTDNNQHNILSSIIENEDYYNTEKTINLSEQQGRHKIKIPDKKLFFYLFPMFSNGQKVIGIKSDKMYFQCLDKNHKSLPYNYLDTHVNFIRFYESENSSSDNKFHTKKIFFEYKYSFLEKINTDIQQTTDFTSMKKNNLLFFGHKKLIETIKNTFLNNNKHKISGAIKNKKNGGKNKNINFNKTDKNCFHYFLSGVGNSGKTWLLKYLYHNLFNKEEFLKKQYITCMLEFKYFRNYAHQEPVFNHALLDSNLKSLTNIPPNYGSFETTQNTNLYSTTSCEDLNIKIANIEKKFADNNRLSSILIIDEYDNFINSFSNDFTLFLNKLHKKYNTYFLFSSRKGKSAYSKKLLPKSFHPVCETAVSSIENPNAVIDFLINSSGISRTLFTPEIKQEILKYSSAMPYFIKRIFYELIKNWIYQDNFTPLEKQDIKNTVLKIIETEKFNTLITSCQNDKNADHRILNQISIMGKGEVEKDTLFTKLISISKKTDLQKEQHIFNNKINYLISAGFIIEKNNKLAGIPYMFYYQGNEIIT